MRINHFFQTVTLSLFAVFGVASITLYADRITLAGPLAAGSYITNSGGMTGSTFTIDSAGLFTAWDLTFPTTPTTNFTSLLPAPVSNFAFPGGSSVISFTSNDIQYYFDVDDGGYTAIVTDILTTNPIVLDSGSFMEASTPIPEPSTLLLSATGLLGLAGYRWAQRRRERTQVE